MTNHQIEANIDTWLEHPNLHNTNGNSSDTTSTMLAELNSILKSFPHIQPDEVLQHLPALSPLSFLVLDNTNDTLTQSQMLKAEDKQEFLDAKEVELQGLLNMRVWKYWRISTLPQNACLKNSVWSYQHKWSADGTLVKYKAQLCADGCQQQQGVDFLHSYAPIITWTTVCLVPLLLVLLNLHCRQVDFTPAFP